MTCKIAVPAAVLIALTVTACDRSPPPNDMANDPVMANGHTTIVPPGGLAASTPKPATPAKLPTQIPAQYHGRWGLNRADCTSTRGDAKGLLTISGGQLSFYESRGTLETVLGATARSFDANYGFSGEGQTWRRTERFKFVNDMLQRRTDAEPGQESPVNLIYSRCGE